jgi:hypothetical protein
MHESENVELIEGVGLNFQDGDLSHAGVVRGEGNPKDALGLAVPWVQVPSAPKKLPFSSIAPGNASPKPTRSAAGKAHGHVPSPPDSDSWYRICFVVGTEIFTKALEAFGSTDLVAVRREPVRFLKALDEAYFKAKKDGLQLRVDPITALRVLGYLGHVRVLSTNELPRSFFKDVIELLELDACPKCKARRAESVQA